MLITEKQIKLKNNQTITLRSATKNDAKAQCDHWTKTAYETPFLARYPEECIFNLQEIENELEAIEKSPISFMINAFDEKQMVANARIVAIKELNKFRHRGYFIISIINEYTNSGLGKIILNEAKEQARKNGFTQIELGLFEDTYRDPKVAVEVAASKEKLYIFFISLPPFIYSINTTINILRNYIQYIYCRIFIF